jgi:hypothetical protein
MPRSSRSICPPGVFCISGSLGNTVIVVVSIALLFLLVAMYLKPQQPTIILPTSHPSPGSSPTVISVKGGDSRYSQAPQPLRDWMSMPEFPPRGGLASIPINIPTRGLPESFQSIGVITVNDKVLPLYGRRTMGGSDRWNYYTRTDTYNPVPLPISFKRRNCMDQVGCNEIDSGEQVRIDGMNVEGRTELYKMDGPKYIPGMI